MQLPKAVIFDLDNTLAEAFHPPRPEMLHLLERLIARIPVALMSAASLERIQRDVLPGFSNEVDFSGLRLFTANAAQCYVYEGNLWLQIYAFGFTPEEHAIIRDALIASVEETGVTEDTKKYGDQIVDYEGYVAFTALGLGAPKEERNAWDSDKQKRQKLRTVLKEKLPQFDVYIGGATSVDVTPKGINKSYGVREYAKQLTLNPSDMLYVGDALYPGGNDEVVIATGVQTRSVSGPDETPRVIEDLLAT
ncbi:HAD-IIB family hydrolase [Candidatus Kaiserbacteria bacterium]|nr:HAD-IIB family hydrolase [Candidatus Kaiserbacteria bacterium]